MCYSILVLPLSLVRWIGYVVPMPFAASLASVSVLGLSGVVNCLLFTLTRPNLLLFGQRREPPPDDEVASVPVLVITRERSMLPKDMIRSSSSTAADAMDHLRMRRLHSSQGVHDGSDADDDASSFNDDSHSTTRTRVASALLEPRPPPSDEL